MVLTGLSGGERPWLVGVGSGQTETEGIKEFPCLAPGIHLWERDRNPGDRPGQASL